jgi:predicted HTH transcriptional regulator
MPIKAVVKYVKLNRKIANKEYQTINEVSNKTAYLELNGMIKLGIFESKGKGKSVMYVMKR